MSVKSVNGNTPIFAREIKQSGNLQSTDESATALAALVLMPLLLDVELLECLEPSTPPTTPAMMAVQEKSRISQN